MTDAVDFQAAIDKAAVNFDRLDQIVNGDATTTVSTDTASVPSIAKLEADLTASISDGVEAAIRADLADQFAIVADEQAVATASAVASAVSANASDAARIGSEAAETNAALYAANAMQAATTAQGFCGALAVAPSGLPYEVTAITGGVGTGSGGTPGTYVGGVSGGPVGFQWSYTIGSDGKLALPFRIDNPGIASTNTAPTLSLPSGGITGATVPTATVGTIPVSRVFLAPNSDASQFLAWSNNGGSLSAFPSSGAQFGLPTGTFIKSLLGFISVPGGEYALQFGKLTGPIYAGITNLFGHWDFGGVRTLPIAASDGTIAATVTADNTRNGFLIRCYDTISKAILWGVQNDGTFVANITVPDSPTVTATAAAVSAASGTAPSLDSRISRGLTAAGSPKSAAQNLGRLRSFRSAMTALKSGAALLIHIILDGDSWWDAKNYGSAEGIAQFFTATGLTNAGPGWIGLASPNTGGGAHGAAQNNIGISRSGTWTSLFLSADATPGAIQNFPGYDAIQSGADGSIVTISGSVLSSCISLTLYCKKGGTVEQSWDGTTWSSVTVTSGSGSTTAAIDLTGKASGSLRLRCTNGTVVAGLFGLTSTTGVVFSNVANSGSTAAQKASVQSNADYIAMMKTLPGDAILACVQLGLNDTKAGTPNATTVTNVGLVVGGYRNIFSGFPFCDVAILCQPNTPLSAQNALSPLLRAWAEDNDAAFLDWQPYFGLPATAGDYAPYARDYTSGAASSALPLLEVESAYRHPSPKTRLTNAGKSLAVCGEFVVAATLSSFFQSPFRSL